MADPDRPFPFTRALEVLALLSRHPHVPAREQALCVRARAALIRERDAWPTDAAVRVETCLRIMRALKGRLVAAGVRVEVTERF